MNKIILPIKGMHCRSCEILIEEKLKEFPEIKNVQVSYKKKQALIYTKHPINQGSLETAIIEAGYEVGVDDSKSWISRDPKAYKDLFFSLIILYLLYLIGNKLGFFNINAGSTASGSYLIVLLIGLTAGISTCAALVGGLVLSIAARHAEKHPEASPIQKFRPHLFFNIGRITSYAILGGLIGLLGKAFQLSGPTLGALTIFVGVVMLIMGAQLIELFPRISSASFTLPPALARLLGIKKHHNKEYSHNNSIMIGALTFFLPCGFTQAMQLFAISTGSFWQGALIMGIFAVGTAPGLLGLGGLASVVKGAFAKKFFKFVGLLVIFLAFFNISNGYNLTGWKNIFAGSDKQELSTYNDPNVTQKDGYQIVKMSQISSGYKPNKFTIYKDIPVKWQIDSKEDRSCAASLSVSKLKIRKALNLGMNEIQFTPTELGEIKFSCSMGMYSGKFIVTENKSRSE
ncbi:MAG: sulfite exporter TauE/SafE family protein [Patescibacteria group bacterium]